jgi:hypothetical protein
MKQIKVGIIGTGWCGGIRAETCAASPFVSELHVAETNPARLKEIAGKTNLASATSDYRELLANDQIDAVIISATPETLHFPMAKESLLAGKHVFLEKPISVELSEADELIELAREKQRFFTIGYSQSVPWSVAISRAAWATRSVAAANCLPPPWKQPTISISCCGAWLHASQSACMRRKCARS